MEKQAHEPVKRTRRSTRRTKNGCLTCRQRRVRCDEGKPVCAKCARLDVQCEYTRGPAERSSFGQRTEASPSSSRAAPSATDNLGGTDTGIAKQTSPLELQTAASNPPGLVPRNEAFMETASVFLGNLVLPFSPIEANTGSTFSETPPAEAPQFNTKLEQLIEKLAPNDTERSLLHHFVSMGNPVPLIIAVDKEWRSTCKELILMAQESNFLKNTIYSFAELHLAMTESRPYAAASAYYDAASGEVRSLAQYGSTLEEDQLKNVVAAMFLLSHVEIMARSKIGNKSWSKFFTHSAYQIVLTFQDRVKSWTGIYRHVLSWIALLENKAIYAGLRDASSIVADEVLLRTSQRDANSSQHELSSSAEIVFDVLNQPAYDFHLDSQVFIRKIVVLDIWHRPRGTLKAEYETLQAGHQISSDLHKMWDGRPYIFNVLSDVQGLSSVLSPSLVSQLCQSLRVYICNFWANFIFLHRVAFGQYPVTEDCEKAVQEILRLSRDEIADAEAQQSPEYSLPSSMLWPMFMAALECPMADRLWIFDKIQNIKGFSDVDRTMQLLREITQRQDMTHQRVDQRFVREELFDDVYDVIY